MDATNRIAPPAESSTTPADCFAAKFAAVVRIAQPTPKVMLAGAHRGYCHLCGKSIFTGSRFVSALADAIVFGRMDTTKVRMHVRCVMAPVAAESADDAGYPVSL